MAEKKAKLKTSEEVFKSLRFVADFDEDSEFFGQQQNLWIGYEDGLYGPMEQLLTAFVPISDGGDLPFTAIWYFRCGDRILWDRRRRLDELGRSGDTLSIQAAARGERVKGFNASADEIAAQETAAAVAKAAVTMATMEEERLKHQAEAQKRRQRQQAIKQREKEDRERKALAAKPRIDAKPVAVHMVGGAAASTVFRSELRALTWNALDDAHADDYPVETRACHRARGLAEAIREQEPDIVAMQEATASVIAAVDTEWPQSTWRTGALGELVVWSRHPIRQAFAVKLGSDTTKEALLVEVAVQRRAVAVACVHFTSDSHGNQALKRSVQAKIVRAALAERLPHADAFVCGDFNEPNSEGQESAAVCMEGLTDAWLAVHGTDHPGYTFDPENNRLAVLGAVCKTPRRIDRIFAAPVWSATAATLVGEDCEHSDHYGVLAAFARQSCLGKQPVHTSAVVVMPPQSAWSQIDEIRKIFDKSYGRWMPHINLIYGFLPEEHFLEASTAMEAVVRNHGPFEVCLEELTVFEHANSASLVIAPRCNPDSLGVLQQELQALFPSCVEQSRHEAGFQPHLTLGKFEGECWADDVRRCKEELVQTWKPISFVVSEVCLIARTGDQPFGVRCQLPLGSSLSSRDRAMLQSLEAGSGGARAFAMGSALLLGSRRPASSDLDVMLVGARERDCVFRDLESNMNADWARRTSGKFPLLQLEVGGTKLDIQYARSSTSEHPAFWSRASCDEGFLAAAALQDNYAIRAAILDRHGMEGWRLFQRSLLKLKNWAKSRCIDNNAIGFIGGFTWSLLLAEALLNEFSASSIQQDDAEEALVNATCKRFSAWAWPKPVMLTRTGADPCSCGDLMPILCPAEPFANSARNVTISTRAILQAELQRRANREVKPPGILDGYHTFVRCQVTATETARAGCAAHWLEARLLVLVKKLDHLNARPLCLGAGLYIVGVSSSAASLEPIVDGFRDVLIRGDHDGDGWSDVIDVQVVDRDAIQATLRPSSKKNAS